MPLSLFEAAGDVPWDDVLVPLISAAIGGAIGAGGARHLRRTELHVQAAEKVNAYIDDAVEALNEIDQEADFDFEKVNRAKHAVNLARFHSERLEEPEVTNRLGVTDFVLWDTIGQEDYSGLHWAHRSIDDVMRAVVTFMVLPRLWPPRWRLVTLPPNWFPNTSKHYRQLTAVDEAGTVRWTGLREWTIERELKLRQELGLDPSPDGDKKGDA